MAITKEKKQSLIKEYVQDLQEANNLVLIKQSWLPVSADAQVRKSVRSENGKFNVIRKKLFLRALKEAWYPDIDLNQLSWSAVAVYSKWDEYAPLKVINKYLKDFQKSKEYTASFEFLGWYFNKEWKDGSYVNELANIPSREELLSKLVWLFNYPVQSLTSVLDQIAKKKVEWWDSAPAAKEEPTVEDTVAQIEEPTESKEDVVEPKEETTEEIVQEKSE